MQVIASIAMSQDGYVDDATDKRRILSSPEDLEEVFDLRDSCDAIMVGANTIRRDDPSLVTRGEARRQARQAAGLAAEPVKVTLTRSGALDADRRFFKEGEGQKIVFCPTLLHGDLSRQLAGMAMVMAVSTASMISVLAVLEALGIRRLLIEGGPNILAQFLAGGHIDVLRVAVAPVAIDEERAPRFTVPTETLHLCAERKLGEMTIMEYERA